MLNVSGINSVLSFPHETISGNSAPQPHGLLHGLEARLACRCHPSHFHPRHVRLRLALVPRHPQSGASFVDVARRRDWRAAALVLPLFLFVVGFIIQNSRTILAGWAVGQAELLGAFVAAVYKAFTGRVHPAHSVGADISHVFRFGWMRGGVFWGWPSSHTTIAFAMAVTVFTLCPKQRWLGWVAILYAGYVGLGVSMTIHWFSDFVAGAIIGSVIGAVVGRSFGNIQHSTFNAELPRYAEATSIECSMLSVEC